MRLVCPNCDAQYEVNDGAIPDGGRDVQCSNCGHTWFQTPFDEEAELEAEEALLAAALAPQGAAVVATPAAKGGVDAKDDQPAVAAKLEQSDLGAEPVSPAKPVPERSEAPPSPPAVPRRSLDESLMAVLREEAERETAVRRSETPRPLETQPDLGLEEPAASAKAVRDRLTRLRANEAAPDVTEKPTARRDLLPDIEEINSTLRASTENRGDGQDMPQDPPENPKARSGFRRGFLMMVLLALILVVAYIAAPQIIEQFPAMKGAMEGFVSTVNQGRTLLDGAMRSAIAALQSLTGG